MIQHFCNFQIAILHFYIKLSLIFLLKTVENKSLRKKGAIVMKEKMRDKGIVKEAVGDPAFYNDQIDKNKEPVKARPEYKKKDRKH